MEDFPVPNAGTAAVHSAVEAPDGSVWLAEQAPNKLADGTRKPGASPNFSIPSIWQRRRQRGRIETHRALRPRRETVWVTGEPLSRFVPETGKFTNYWETGHTYSIANDTQGNIWFTITGTPGQVVKMDWQTLKMTRYAVPTKDGLPRRIQIDSKGIIWFGEYNRGKLGSFDPTTATFHEYDLPTVGMPQFCPHFSVKGLSLKKDSGGAPPLQSRSKSERLAQTSALLPPDSKRNVAHEPDLLFVRHDC